MRNILEYSEYENVVLNEKKLIGRKRGGGRRETIRTLHRFSNFSLISKFILTVPDKMSCHVSFLGSTKKR
jgi:hypothetical protein